MSQINPTTPVEMDYTDRDYNSIRQFLVSAARGYVPEWVTVGEPADFGTLLLEMYAYVGDTLNYYIDRCAAEPFLATAVRRQSILGIADMLGYVPISQQAASGGVTFSIDPVDNVGAVTVPVGTVVQTPVSQTTEMISFETLSPAYLDPDATVPILSVEVGAREGITVRNELLALSNGAPMQEYVMHYAGVIHRSMDLRVKETDQQDMLSNDPAPLTQQWSYVDNLVDTDPDASVFTTYADDRGFVHVVFGDNVAGRIPPVGAQIFVSYRYGVGARGNVAPSTISLITPPIPSVSVNNTTAFQGGADNESIDQMRHSIPRAAKLRDRAITLQDYADLCFQVPGVGKAVAIGEFYTQIKLWIAPVGGGYPNEDLLAAVYSYVSVRSLVGTTVEMHPENPRLEEGFIDEFLYTYVLVHMTVHVLPSYGQLTVKNAVTQAIIGVFSFDNPAIDFGCFISRGAVYHAALNVSGVDWIELHEMQALDDGGRPIDDGIASGFGPVQDIQAQPTRIPLSDIGHITIDAEGGLV